MEEILLALGVTGALALLDIAAMLWGVDSRDAGDVPQWLHRHPRTSI